MKRILCPLLCLMLCLSLCACEKTPNMQTLLSYQKNGTAFHILVNGTLSATVTLGEETAVALENEEFQTLVYRFSEGKTTLSNGDLTVPLTSDRHIKAKAWAALFALPCDAPWDIDKAVLDGAEVYRCRTERVTLYISKDGTPLRMESGDTVITVLGVS